MKELSLTVITYKTQSHQFFLLHKDKREIFGSQKTDFALEDIHIIISILIMKDQLRIR